MPLWKGRRSSTEPAQRLTERRRVRPSSPRKRRSRSRQLEPRRSALPAPSFSRSGLAAGGEIVFRSTRISAGDASWFTLRLPSASSEPSLLFNFPLNLFRTGRSAIAAGCPVVLSMPPYAVQFDRSLPKMLIGSAVYVRVLMGHRWSGTLATDRRPPRHRPGTFTVSADVGWIIRDALPASVVWSSEQRARDLSRTRLADSGPRRSRSPCSATPQSCISTQRIYVTGNRSPRTSHAARSTLQLPRRLGDPVTMQRTYSALILARRTSIGWSGGGGGGGALVPRSCGRQGSPPVDRSMSRGCCGRR